MIGLNVSLGTVVIVLGCCSAGDAMPPRRADKAFVQYLSRVGYHPRSSAHGDTLCTLVLTDLERKCRALADLASRRKLVYKLNHTVNPESPLRWNIDLVLGPPVSADQSTLISSSSIQRGEPRGIWVAIDAKTVMTEHGKARRNRQRDFNAMHDILHRSDPLTVVGGLLVVNLAERFRSPLRDADVTEHRNIDRLVEETIEMFEELPRSPAQGGAGLEALGVIVVSHSNLPGEPTSLVSKRPAPARGSSIHYQTFLQDICEAFVHRFVD